MPLNQSHKIIQPSYSLPGGLSKVFVRSFSVNPKLSKTEADLLKIEADPFLYVDIQTNKFQQAVWAEKLAIPREFVHLYFDTIRRIQEGKNKANSFDPSRFGEDTPKTVVIEYMKTIQEDLINAHQKYGKKKDLTVSEIIKLEGFTEKGRRPGMPQPVSLTKTELSETEKLKMQYEKDVFEMNLNEEAESIVDGLLKSYKEATLDKNPLLRDEFKPSNRDVAASETLKYLKTDRMLKNDALLDVEEIFDLNRIKAEGLSNLLKKKDPEYLAQQNEDKLKWSTLANIKVDQILQKRVQLKNKLKMLEELHKNYENERINGPSAINPSRFSFFKNLEQANPSSPSPVVERIYKGGDKNVVELETIYLKLANGAKDQKLNRNFENKISQIVNPDLSVLTLQAKYAVLIHNDVLALSSFQNLVEKANSLDEKGGVQTFLPVDFPLFKDLFNLFLSRDNFRALGLLINYAEQRKLKITNLDLSPFKPSLEYYLNHNFKMSNLLVYMKYYVYKQECLFKEFNLTPQSLNNLSAAELKEYGSFLFPSTGIADMRDLFSYLVKRLTLRDTSNLSNNEIIGSNKIIDSLTKKDVMERFITYFTQYTVPFMDIPHLVPNFIRENDIADYYAGKFDEPNSLESVMNLAHTYGERTLFHNFIQENLDKYKNRNFGNLPPSYSKDNIMKFINDLNEKIRSREASRPNERTQELLLSLMQNHKMVNEMMKLNAPLKNHYITEAILGLQSDDSDDFYSSKVSQLFKTKKDKESELYTACMMKALLKEGDLASAMRVLEEGEKALVDRRKAIEKYYVKVYDQ